MPLTKLSDIVYGGGDIHGKDVYKTALSTGVLNKEHLDPIKDNLQAIRPMKAVFDQAYIRNLSGSWIKEGKTKMDLADHLQNDIETFKDILYCQDFYKFV